MFRKNPSKSHPEHLLYHPIACWIAAVWAGFRKTRITILLRIQLDFWKMNIQRQRCRSLIINMPVLLIISTAEVYREAWTKLTNTALLFYFLIVIRNVPKPIFDVFDCFSRFIITKHLYHLSHNSHYCFETLYSWFDKLEFYLYNIWNEKSHRVPKSRGGEAAQKFRPKAASKNLRFFKR